MIIGIVSWFCFLFGVVVVWGLEMGVGGDKRRKIDIFRQALLQGKEERDIQRPTNG
jgi:hypothetical protein